MTIRQKRVLITGSNGFIGGHLAKRLVEFKGIRVRGLIKNQLIPTERIDGLPVERAFGDMTSLEAMRDATCCSLRRWRTL
jgi:nucleoside-diphosphate-sugar epimerase